MYSKSAITLSQLNYLSRVCAVETLPCSSPTTLQEYKTNTPLCPDVPLYYLLSLFQPTRKPDEKALLPVRAEWNDESHTSRRLRESRKHVTKSSHPGSHDHSTSPPSLERGGGRYSFLLRGEVGGRQ